MKDIVQPKVAIILVNYNGYKDTVECVSSLLECSYSNYEIIIVENGSGDAQALKEDTFLNEHSTILYSRENQGFSEGNNIGIRYAKAQNADFVLLLNNDTIVKKDFLDKLVACAMQDEKIAITTSIINYFYDQNRTWYDFGTFDRLTGYTRMLSTPSSHAKLAQGYEVTFSTGCLMLIRMQCLEQMGGELSNDYFLYSEDTDLCLNALDHGFKIVSVPEVLIYHKVNGSTGTGSDLQQYYLTRNYLILAKKYGTCFPIAYVFRWLLSKYEIFRYGYNPKVIKKAFHDLKKEIIGKVDGFR